MRKRLFHAVIRVAVVLAAVLSVGCEGEWVTRVARSNLASFMTDVFSIMVNETINP